MEPKFQVQLKIRKPVAEVFDAVVNPAKLTGYFLQTSSGPLVEGATVKWKFQEVEEPFDVVVGKVVANERIEFDWPSGKDSPDTHVEMVFKPLDGGSTMVQISESGWPATEAGFKSSHGNAGGWMHMLACLKAYIEYGINLRAGGAF
ncbi:uncharacterized protein YndB with AHSA1/START domain [Caulobacter ginsengisoli]|uniref:Uncharacterized protein YndB with AHSA1/START domain n=1 Tax=Caulobacter ginsengisoli TaxID=400775 RepID=A0ABU0IRJ6_9CAUL|nr:SRPBCC domain-containing protein [Caulobacter ginsengisoli]MDQ0463783.1 uncharacterized protein YndB with AHSA1/START domain [Caulobacter ginsengisoli]